MCGIVPQIQQSGDKRTLIYGVRHGHLTRAVLANYAEYAHDRVPAEGTLRRQEVRDGPARYRGRWLVIDEFTRAPIDAAFGSLLTTLGGQRSPLAVPTDDGEVAVPLPRDFRIIGTLNSFDRHFLNQISEAMKRRFTFIDVLPPPRSMVAAEQGMVAYRALLHLREQGLADITVDETGRVTWEDLFSVAWSEATERTDARYAIRFEDVMPPTAPGAASEQETVGTALDSFWRIFSAVRRTLCRQRRQARRASKKPWVQHSTRSGVSSVPCGCTGNWERRRPRRWSVRC